jgi:hypothetical protein
MQSLVAVKALEEARLHAGAYHHGQTEIVRRRHSRRTAVRGTRSRIARQQSGGELSPAGSAARAKTAAVQITGISPTVPVDPRCRLQCLLRSTPSSIPPHLQSVSSRDARCLESKLACRLIWITIEFWRPCQLTCQCPPAQRGRAQQPDRGRSLF